MDAIEMIKERRSVRKFKDEKVDRETMREIVSISKWAPSWANFQVARYTLVDDESIIKGLSTGGVKGFVYNINTLKNAKGVAVLSFVKGKSGKLDTDEYVTSKGQYLGSIRCRNRLSDILPRSICKGCRNLHHGCHR